MRDQAFEELGKQLEVLRNDLASKVRRVEELERNHEEMMVQNARQVQKLLDLEVSLVKQLDSLEARLRFLESPEESLPPDDRSDYRKV